MPVENALDRWKRSPLRAELRRLYEEVDALLSPFTCESTTECCRFGVTGREPYPTPVEVAELAVALRSLGGAPRTSKRLPLHDDGAERRCPLLTGDGSCRVYASRPFGCRTFFCDRIQGPKKFPRADVQRLSRAIADLSARHDPRAPHARPLTRVLPELLG